jgi:hypothetical protein
LRHHITVGLAAPLGRQLIGLSPATPPRRQSCYHRRYVLTPGTRQADKTQRDLTDQVGTKGGIEK